MSLKYLENKQMKYIGYLNELNNAEKIYGQNKKLQKMKDTFELEMVFIEYDIRKLRKKLKRKSKSDCIVE